MNDREIRDKFPRPWTPGPWPPLRLPVRKIRIEAGKTTVQARSFTVKTDGTPGGTTLKVDGKELDHPIYKLELVIDARGSKIFECFLTLGI